MHTEDADGRAAKLPAPKPTIPHQPGWEGQKLIVPVTLEGYHKGYESMVQDEYVPAYGIDPAKAGKERMIRHDWQFRRRVRVFTRPLHYDLSGKPYACEACQMWWEKFPETPADEVIQEASLG